MSGTKSTLTKQVLAAKEKIHQLNLWTFDAVEDDAFLALSPLRRYINLSGLHSLSESSAEIFSKHPGILQLDGLTEISDAVAEILAKQKGSLWLNGLPTMSVAAAKALGKHEGQLFLQGLKILSPEASKALSGNKIYYARGEVKDSEKN